MKKIFKDFYVNICNYIYMEIQEFVCMYKQEFNIAIWFVYTEFINLIAF